MLWRVIAERDFTAAYGGRLLTFTTGEVIEGEVANYLAATRAPVRPADQPAPETLDTPATDGAPDPAVQTSEPGTPAGGISAATAAMGEPAARAEQPRPTVPPPRRPRRGTARQRG